MTDLSSSTTTIKRESVTQPTQAYTKPPFKEATQDYPGLEAEMQSKPDFGETTYVGHDRLKDKICLVTGGDSGIGRAVALAFAREGAKGVCISYLQEEEVDAKHTESVCKKDTRCDVLSVPCNLSSDTGCKDLVQRHVDKFGSIDVLVLNHAFQNKEVDSFDQLTRDIVESTFMTNICSFFNIVRHALPYLNKNCSIICTSSIQSYKPNPGILPYACSKAAITEFVHGLCKQKQLLNLNCRVNCVAPGPVLTPLIVQSFKKEKVEKFQTSHPYGRCAQPAELAPSFVFLADNCTGSFVNGSVIDVTGGKLFA